MCGLAGLVLGRKRRRLMERVHLGWLFSRLLELNEVRGPHATGAAWVNRDGEHGLLKYPLRSSLFVRLTGYPEFIGHVDNRVTVLMGHTRWRTRGTEANSRNNHPILASNRRGRFPGTILGTHNGTITNADWLFERFGVTPQTQVDSEILIRTMAASWTAAGFDERTFLRRLRLFQGQISAVFACKEDPTRVIILKGNKPLAFRYHRKHRAILYSSLEAHLDEAIEEERGWRELDIPPMSLLVLNTDDLQQVDLKPIIFKAQSRVARAIQEEVP